MLPPVQEKHQITTLLEHEANLGGGHAGALPVVEVVLQVPVTNPEF